MSDGRLVAQAIWPPRAATSVNVVSPMSGRPGRPRARHRDVDALETDVLDELGAQWGEGTRPALQDTGVQPGAQRLRLSVSVTAEEKRSIRRSLADLGCGGQHRPLDDDVECAAPTGGDIGQTRGGVEEPLLLRGVDDPVGESGELLLVLFAGEWASTERVGVGDGELVGDDRAVLHSDDRAGTEGFSSGSSLW